MKTLRDIALSYLDACEDRISILEVKILLSWGGPADGFKLTFDTDKNLIGGVYYRANWGEYQEARLTDDEAEGVFSFYMGGELL